MDKAKITIIDVARKAGVSKGTVDRVLHNRGEVSARSAEKVRAAIKDLNFEPNIYASLLASKKAHVIACVLPAYKEGEYWEKIYNGVMKGQAQVAQLNMTIKVFLYNQYDSQDFCRACSEALDASPSGVVLPPLFMNDTISFTSELKARGIPYAYVDSKLEDPSYFAYFGMPMYKSGYLCAYLLSELSDLGPGNEVVIVRVNRDKNRQSDPTVNRRAGFMDYMESARPDCKVHNIFINPSDPEGTGIILDDFFRNHPSVRNVVMFNSRIHLLAEYLDAHPLDGRHAIGFDDLERNISMLKSGTVSLLISQHSEDQACQAVVMLSDFIQLGKAPSDRDNYMHMDILSRYNLENY